MNKHLPIFTFLFLFPLFLFSNNNAELASSAGTMNLDPQSVCGQVPPSHNGDEVLDAGDVLRFVIHDNNGATLGNVLDGQGGAMEGYGFFPGMVFGTTYYLSAIVGMDDGTGNVDLTDPELSIAQGTPIVFNDSPTADGSSSNLLTCVNSQTTLSATGSSLGSEFSYSWQGISGNAVGFSASTFDATTSQDGTYILTVTNTITGCDDAVVVMVEIDQDLPTAVIVGSGILTCASTTVTLSGSGSSGPNIVYEWLDGLGAVLSTTLTLTVTSSGLYELIITNIDSGCSALASVVIVENTVIPIADAGPDMVLDCNNSEVTLDGSGSSQGANFVYEWTTFDGSIISGANAMNPVVNLEGTYLLVVTDIINGCTSIDEVLVTGDGGIPIDLGDDFYFDCNLTEMMIVGNSIPSGAGITHQWTTADGSILFGATTPTPTIGSAGTYVLDMDDTNLGCQGTAEIVVYNFEDIVSVNENMTLNCNTSNPNELDAMALLPNLNLTYSWTTTNGNILSDPAMLNPIVSTSVGTYDLTYTDAVTGCSDMATVQMDTFLFPTPILNIPGNQNLGCTNNWVTLDASDSSPHPLGTGPLSYQWNLNGVPAGSSAATFTAGVPGFYQVLIFDQDGCLTAAEAEVVYINLFTLEDTLTLDCNNNFTQEVGPVLGGNQNPFYFWNDSNGNQISTDSSVVFTGAMEGSFELVISDGNLGCVETDTIEIVSNGFGINISTTPAGCDLEDGTATATSGLPNGLTEWSTGEQGGSISELAQGWYSVTITDTDNNCSRHDNFFIDEDISCKVVISGYVLEDPNNTCTYDANLTPVECVMVKLDPLGIFTMTDATGYYEFVVDDGSYTIEYIGSAEVDLQCPLPGTYGVTLNTNGLISPDNHFYVLRPDFDLCMTRNMGAVRPGFDQFNCVQICNFGDDMENAVVTFIHDNLFSNQTPWPSISPAYGNTIASTYTYDEATNTFTWNLDDLAPGECRKIMWWMPVPVTAMIGEMIYSEAKVNPIAGDANPDNNCLVWSQTVTGSYDPNDKRNFIGESEWGGPFYNQTERMQYAIRFQNVGNDTAFTVVVRDTLDEEYLDVTTLRGFTGSHDMEVQFEDSNVLIFTFNNILLVDSMTNEPASNGWVNFDIDLKQSIPLHTEIRNKAAIYFDYNAPVITNELVDYFTNEVSVFSPIENEIQVEITPTITNDKIRVHYVVGNTNSVSMQVYNVGGVLLEDVGFGKKEAGEHVENLSLKDFTAGVYFVFVKTDEGSAVRKVVKF
ncbi:MAG: T9SS type A sorting domain-containing protein [Saprospiraceae bacterium]